MKIKLSNRKIINTVIYLIVLLFIILAIILIPKTKVIEFAKNKVEEQVKAEMESNIKNIIDETKAWIQENESREPLLSDLKEKFKEQGYILDETTGEIEDSGYVVKIDENLNIVSIEEVQTKAFYEIISTNGNILNILLTIENKNGIEKITASDVTIQCNGREKVAIDRALLDGQEYQVRIKIVGEEQEELRTLVASTKPAIVVKNNDAEGDITKTVEIEYPNNENVINYYSLDDGETWKEYTGALNELEVFNKAMTAKSLWKEGKTIEKLEEKRSLIISDSLLSVAGRSNMRNDRYYKALIEGTEYNIHSYIEDVDTILETDKIYGDENDVATASEYAKNMVIVKVNGDLTINSGVTLTTYGSTYGGPKGMLLYVTGTLTNNGTVSMTGRGAKAVGQNVYLWNNSDGSYEYVPEAGVSGGAGGRGTGNYGGRTGSVPATATNRKTGGGGGGAGQDSTTGGSGSAGTSYSGGSGGGGGSVRNGGNALANGATGGRGYAGLSGIMNTGRIRWRRW